MFNGKRRSGSANCVCLAPRAAAADRISCTKRFIELPRFFSRARIVRSDVIGDGERGIISGDQQHAIKKVL